ncbi:transport and Golgi organization protein 1 isoform X3 [Phymastichus coffea]|uniref:transport and Golgi organization protein 1 isoform X3 n=1 Tax=Phymastichus coffea TaxID=108790 RepID=UPI00273AB9E1|nr:transport and Golgi organization protein 1 isoform X3 [Phymastichus coffea]
MLRAAVRNGDVLSPRQRNMRFVVIAILSLIFSTCCVAKLSDKRLCYDKDCSVMISTGKTTLPYNPTDPDLLSFPGNVEVKVYSKAAGSREDLWGVEINGKRGYVSKKFIREYKIFMKDLKHTVPVETATDETVEKNIPKSESTTVSNGDDVTSPVQMDESKVQVLKDEPSESDGQDTISPEHVTPTFESIYDGTILPQEIDEVEPVSPSYSVPTALDSSKVEENVQLELQPNILSSTFSAFSNLFSGDDESGYESEEDEEGVNLVTSEKIQTKETTTKTPGIIKEPDKSSSVLKQTPEEVFKNEELIKNIEIVSKVNVSEKKVEKLVPEVKIEESIQEVKTEDTVLEQQTKELSQEVKIEATVQEIKTIKTTEEIISDETVPEAKIDEVIIGSLSNSSVHLELEKLYKEKEVAKDPIENDKKEVSEKQVIQEEKAFMPADVNEEKVTNVKQIEKSQVKKDSPIHIPNSEVVVELKENVNVGIRTKEVEETPIITNTNIEKPFQIIMEDGVGGIEENVDNVPNEKTINVSQNTLHVEQKIVESLSTAEASNGQKQIVDNNAFSTENNTSPTVSSQDTILNKQADGANDAFANSATSEESIIIEVPSNQDVKLESVKPSSESFVPLEPFYQANISSNDVISSKQLLKISKNLSAPHTFVEELKPIETEWTVENQQQINKIVVDSNNNNNIVVDTGYTATKPTYIQNESTVEIVDSSIDSNRENIVDIPSTSSFGEFLGNRNLLNAGKDSEEIGVDKIVIGESVHSTVPPASDESIVDELKQEDENISTEDNFVDRNNEKVMLPMDTCDINSECSDDTLHKYTAEANAVTSARKMTEFNSDTLLIVCITAVTTLLFSLGYYFLENKRRDAFLIAKINKLEANLMKTEKECFEIQEKFMFTKTKLNSIEDESFGSNEMVTSLKAELASSENVREELENQIASLEKELESTSEAGLELERMLREILSSQNEENNPLAQSIEELQTRLNDQQVANESLKAALTTKTQELDFYKLENENLTGDLTVSIKKIEELQTEVIKLTAELESATSTKNNIEETLSSKVGLLSLQVKSMTEDKNTLQKQLKLKELEVKELLDVINKFNTKNLDFEKLYEVSKVKADAAQLLEERDELRTKISDEEGARQLLEEHVRLITEEVTVLSEQCKVAEKEKLDAKTQLEVLKHFFEEREAQRQKEEKQWLEKQGEHSSVVERLQTMQNEILNYKQRLEISEREILNQEKEYKSTIAALEIKAHEHWVMARQSERRLEEIKNESSQLRIRLTKAEQSINDADPETKIHRLQVAAAAASNGEAERTPLYPGGETSSSPLMFVPGGPPPPLPPYHQLFPLPPFLPPPTPPETSRPTPLGGGRLSSPPPHPSSASNPATSPPLSPPPHLFHHLPLPHELLPPPPLPLSSSHNSWGDEPLPPPNANTFRPHGFHRPRNHKGSLHSSGESLDKSHHSSKV